MGRRQIREIHFVYKDAFLQPQRVRERRATQVNFCPKLLPEPERLVLGLELPERLEVALDVLDRGPLGLADAAKEARRRRVDPGPERPRRGHEVGLQPVYIKEAVPKRAAEVLVELGEAHVRLLADLDWHHGHLSSGARVSRAVAENATGERAFPPSPARTWRRGSRSHRALHVR